MERKQCSSSSSPTKKVERKIKEKNRRNKLKHLYSKLNSLLPNPSSKEAVSLPEQIDEAIHYIKILQTKLKELEEKKERLMGRKRSYACTINNTESMACPISPQIRIHEMGSNLEITLTSGVDNQSIFYEVIHILHEYDAEISNANFSVVGNTIFHVIHAEIRDTMFGFGAAKITERLNRLVHGSISEGELQSPAGLWDYEIDPDLLLGIQNPLFNMD